MRSIIVLSYFLLMISSSCSQAKKREINSINSCYNKQLEALIHETDYKHAHNQFKEFFPTLQSKERILQYREYKIDEAVFFNDKKDKLLLLILQKKSGDRDYFGYGRVVVGERKGNGEWVFALDREYLFDKEWYQLFERNTFDNISRLSRYFVLKAGIRRGSGCNIDETFWFESKR